MRICFAAMTFIGSVWFLGLSVYTAIEQTPFIVRAEPVTGKVYHRDLRTRHDDNRATKYHLYVKYSYVYDGKNFASDRYHLRSRPKPLRSWRQARQALGEYELDEEVQVWVDPESPNRSVLNPQVKAFGPLLWLMNGLVLMTIMVGIWMHLGRTLPVPAYLPGRDDEYVRVKCADYSPPRFRAWQNVACVWLCAIVTGAAWSIWLEAASPPNAELVLLMMGGFGMVPVAMGIREYRRLRIPLREVVSIAPQEPRLGAMCRIHVSLCGRHCVKYDREWRLGIECVEEVYSWSDFLWKHRAVYSNMSKPDETFEEDGGHFIMKRQMCLPSDKPPSRIGADRRFVWMVVIAVARSRTRKYPISVVAS